MRCYRCGTSLSPLRMQNYGFEIIMRYKFRRIFSVFCVRLCLCILTRSSTFIHRLLLRRLNREIRLRLPPSLRLNLEWLVCDGEWGRWWYIANVFAVTSARRKTRKQAHINGIRDRHVWKPSPVEFTVTTTFAFVRDYVPMYSLRIYYFH